MKAKKEKEGEGAREGGERKEREREVGGKGVPLAEERKEGKKGAKKTRGVSLHSIEERKRQSAEDVSVG